MSPIMLVSGHGGNKCHIPAPTAPAPPPPPPPSCVCFFVASPPRPCDRCWLIVIGPSHMIGAIQGSHPPWLATTTRRLSPDRPMHRGTGQGAQIAPGAPGRWGAGHTAGREQVNCFVTGKASLVIISIVGNGEVQMTTLLFFKTILFL